MIKVKQAKFITSAKNLLDCPPEDIVEIVFLGRSNVGKSTLINILTNNHKLAKSSSTPGKTQLINFFEILWECEGRDFRLRFVDLPGFGYAKVSKDIKNEWEKNLWNFLKHRNSIKLFMHLLDSRHPKMKIDIEVGEILQNLCRGDQNVIKIYTKCDKLNNAQRELLSKKGLLISTNSSILKDSQGSFKLIVKEILKKVFDYENCL